MASLWLAALLVVVSASCGPAGVLEHDAAGGDPESGRAGRAASDRSGAPEVRQGPEATVPSATARLEREADPIPEAAAYRVVALPGREILREARPDILRTPVAPGSVAKVATLIAALEAGVVEATTAMACEGGVAIDGHRLTCAHPRLGRPIAAAEALAHSCNTWFTAVAARLSRGTLDASRVRVGLPPTRPGASLRLAAVGLDGSTAAPEAMFDGFLRLVAGLSGSRTSDTAGLGVVREGLRGAAEYGTASSFAVHRVAALVKTGTAPMPGGGSMGLVVAAAPPEAPARAVVVVAPGGSGQDAAEIAARLLAEPAAGRPGAATAGGGRRPPPSASHRAADGGRRVDLGRLQRDGSVRVESIAIDDYVAGVVAAEAPPGAGPAALEALAVVVRTYALANLGRHRDQGFDLCDLTHCQVFGRADRASRGAADATSRLVLADSGKVAPVVYSASCGGRLELPSAVWGDTQSDRYFTRRIEPECRDDSVWSAEIAAADLLSAFHAAGIRGRSLSRLWVDGRSASGLVKRVGLEGFTPDRVSGEEFRLLVGRTLGWALLKSARFDVTRTARGYRFSGSGRGHLAGMCLAGAARLADAGVGRDGILAAYFPGLRLMSVPGPGVEPAVGVTLPLEHRTRAAEVRALAAAELRSLERATGERVDGPVELVFHDSVVAFERATGRPGWNSASTIGPRVDLLPIEILDRRDILRRTLRHELAHVITQKALAGRPLWVVEGAAAYFAGPDEGAGERVGGAGGGESGHGEPGRLGGVGCPGDGELTRPVSARAAAEAYERARACFAAELARVGRWDEVGRR